MVRTREDYASMGKEEQLVDITFNVGDGIAHHAIHFWKPRPGAGLSMRTEQTKK